MKKLMTSALALGLGFGLAAPAAADGVYQTLPFGQDWTNTSLISVSDDWSGVPGITGYRGDNVTATISVDPQTLLLADAAPTVDVNANQLNPATFTSGGVAEFEIADPVVALQGSGTADAPYLQIHVDATGKESITISYNLRDVDAAADDAIQPMALHFRVGESGDWTNVAEAYVADCSTGPNFADLVTPITVVLPAEANNQAQLQIRIMTVNVFGSDEWIGIDDITITGTDSPVSSGTQSWGSVKSDF